MSETSSITVEMKDEKCHEIINKSCVLADDGDAETEDVYNSTEDRGEVDLIRCCTSVSSSLSVEVREGKCVQVTNLACKIGADDDWEASDVIRHSYFERELDDAICGL